MLTCTKFMAETNSLERTHAVQKSRAIEVIRVSYMDTEWDVLNGLNKSAFVTSKILGTGTGWSAYCFKESFFSYVVPWLIVLVLLQLSGRCDANDRWYCGNKDIISALKRYIQEFTERHIPHAKNLYTVLLPCLGSNQYKIATSKNGKLPNSRPLKEFEFNYWFKKWPFGHVPTPGVTGKTDPRGFSTPKASEENPPRGNFTPSPFGPSGIFHPPPGKFLPLLFINRGNVSPRGEKILGVKNPRDTGNAYCRWTKTFLKKTQCL